MSELTPLSKPKNLYYFITPSDAITFFADSDTTAFLVTVYLSGGKASLSRWEPDGDSVDIATLTAFAVTEEARNEMYKAAGAEDYELEFFNRLDDVIEALYSFRYSTPESRGLIDALQAEAKTNHSESNFLADHLNSGTSMTETVKKAFGMAREITLQKNTSRLSFYVSRLPDSLTKEFYEGKLDQYIKPMKDLVELVRNEKFQTSPKVIGDLAKADVFIKALEVRGEIDSTWNN